jgi:DNA-binding NarL/FixJ family response regulator
MSRDTSPQAVRSRIRGSNGPWTSTATGELSIRLGERPLKSTLPRSAHAPLGATCPIIASVSTTPTRVVLADDDVLLREGLAGLLERSGFEVVGQSGTANELLELVRDLRPDLAIVDIRMPPTHTSEGLEAATRIREEFPDTAIVVLTAHVQVERATELLAGGRRSGYLLKTRVTDVDEFIETLERIVRGGAVVDPALVSELFAARRVEDPLTFSRRASARCSRSWPKAGRTPASPTSSGSRSGRSRSTSAASS